VKQNSEIAGSSSAGQ